MIKIGRHEVKEESEEKRKEEEEQEIGIKEDGEKKKKKRIRRKWSSETNRCNFFILSVTLYGNKCFLFLVFFMSFEVCPRQNFCKF